VNKGDALFDAINKLVGNLCLFEEFGANLVIQPV
jgi:hypothetical protein